MLTKISFGRTTNEEVVFATMCSDIKKMGELQAKIADLQCQIYEPVKKIVEYYQEGITTEEKLLQVKKYY